MNLKDLKYLVAVADHLHFGKAADAVFISQSTLSGQIKKLEEQLQVTIFERTTRGVNITPIGEKIIGEARQIMTHAQKIVHLAAAQSDILCGELKLGIIPTIAPYLVPHFLSQSLADHPRMTLSLHEDKTEALYAMLANFTIDAAIIATEIPPENIEEIELYHEDFLFLCPTAHPLSNKSCIEAQDINPEDLLLLPEGHCLRDQTLELCKLNNEVVSGQADLRDAGLQTVIELVRAGRGYTFLPKLATGALNDQTGSTSLKRFSPQPKRTVRMVFRKSFPRKSCLVALAKLISSAPSLNNDLALRLQ